ncbi:MAG TPA: hypothetical protein VI854_01705, partial [Acidimicrobiia bacterium]|nr:hypothetical protein [Acidimicrobiia bacterium]
MPGLLSRVLAGDDPGPVFVPWLWELAADRAGLSLEEMAASATTLVAALTSAAQLVEAEAVTVLVDD